MADSQLVPRIQELLNEEKWTRATLANYSIANLKELDALVEEAKLEKTEDDVKAVCDEHLTHTKTSIIALYVSGIITLMHQQIDDSAMVQLLDIFADSKRWNVVEFICNRILDFGDNRMALRRLSEVFENENESEKKFATWEKLIRDDFEEADIVKALAEHKERNGLHEESIDFYKKALHRYINKGLSSNVKEIWTKLVESCPQDIDFFFHVQRKIAKQFSVDKAAFLLGDLYRHYKGIEDWNTALDILQLIISYDDKSPNLRKEVMDCYRGKYAGHSHLDDYIRMSNLSQSYRSLSEAMADFEKHIAFDAGNFVFHRTWNVGRIATIKGDEIVIDFAKSRGHKMTLKMAIDSLTSLSRDHIWVLKAVWSKEKLKDKVKSDPVWTLKTIIKSFDNRADLKKIKAELVPSVLSASEWNSWSAKARESIKSDPLFGNAQDDIDTFIVRDRALSREEKIYNQFKAEKNFFARVQYMRDFLDCGEPDSEFFGEMLALFTGFVRTYQNVNEFVLSSYLFLKEIAGAHPHINSIAGISFAEMFAEIEDPYAIYESIKDSKLKKEFLSNIKNFVAEWTDVYVRLFPFCLSPEILAQLESTGHIEKIKSMVMNIDENYKDYREAFIWVVRNLTEEPWFKDAGIPRDKILIKLLHILDLTFKEMDSHRDTTENRRINKQVQTILFKEGQLKEFLSQASSETIERIFVLVGEVKDLDPAIKLDMRREVSRRFPDFKFGNEEEKTIVSRGLIVTPAMYEEKNRILQHILEVEVPINQKEIAYALSLGDLRENAEYKAAKEKQDELNSKVGKLKNEIERAQLFDKTSINTAKVSFGTIVKLNNDLANHTESYTILGPWESDPDSNIISYLSPLGKKLFNRKIGDKLSFLIGERSFQYTVMEITAIKG
ncbi:MAG: transcription elongation factor GreA [Rectinemataceae bacterium]|nr:transcription elongation factor GreA [Rectinemataceae bacterium]